MAVAELQSRNVEAYAQKPGPVDWLVPKRLESTTETLQASHGETVVYEKGKSRTRKIVGEGMVWGGAIYGLYNLVTLDLGGALAGGIVWVAGRWVRPKEGQ